MNDKTEDRIYQATIYLRSGQSFVISVTNLTIRKTVSGEYHSIEWHSPEDTEDKAYVVARLIRFEDVSAITLQ